MTIPALDGTVECNKFLCFNLLILIEKKSRNYVDVSSCTERTVRRFRDCSISKMIVSSGGAMEGLGALVPIAFKIRQKLSKKNDIELVGYTCRLKTYAKFPARLLHFLELAPPLIVSLKIREIQNGKFAQKP